MIEELKDSIGIEIIKINNSENLIDIIIRGEMQNKNQGFIIHSTNNKNIDYKNLYEDIRNLKLNETERYLIQNHINYNPITFI